MPSSSSKIDAAIVRALGLDRETATVSSHGGSGFASTLRITTPTESVFVKTSSSPGAATMFEGEHASLNAIHEVVPAFCPKSFAWGELESTSGFFLATEFLDMTSSSQHTGRSSRMNLAQKLAKLHNTPAPVPEGFDRPMFGFPVTTCCGDTPQPNAWESSWADFFAKNRLLAILEIGERNNGKDAELRTVVEMTASNTIPRLLGDKHLGYGTDGHGQGVIPVVCHGDLWSGNHGSASFLGRGNLGQEEVVFDPSAVYGHSEYELGIMKMFGGFR